MSTDIAPKPEEVTLTIDGVQVSVPKGSLLIRAAESVGIEIPRFCDHPLLEPAGSCRQCLVEIPDMGNGRGMPKPQAACTTEVMPGMRVETAATNEVAAKAQRGNIEFLLVNHPLDCPICDKGGECPLQNQAMSHGQGESRFHDLKRTFPKPVNVSQLVLLDRERCVLCARCTRFAEQIAGDPFIALVERGALQQVGEFAERPFESNFSGNVIQICPVGALTSSDYRFQSRPFDLVSTETSCEHCAAGCALRTDHRHYQVKRRLAGLDPEVNEEWSCDKGRFGFLSARGTDRLTTPLVRRDGKLVPASWHEAIDAAVVGLKAAGQQVGVLTGGRLLDETSYAYGRFARAVLGTNNIDFRSRPHSAEEASFLAARVAGRTLAESVTYTELEKAKRVILVNFEPEEESPIVFLRLRKAVRKNKLEVLSVASHLSNGSRKMGARLVPALPGHEALTVQALPQQTELGADTIILVGERAAQSAGTLSAVAELADSTGARLAWIPRRAGDLGAIEAGCLPNLLPGGRPVEDATARVDLQAAWGVDRLPSQIGLSADEMLAATAAGQLKALVVSGVQLADFADPAAARAAVESAGFVVSLENRLSQVSERADVVFPVSLVEEQAGSFTNWEHRKRVVNVVNRQNNAPMTEIRVLAALADAMGSDLGVRGGKQAAAEIDELGAWEGQRANLVPAQPQQPADGVLLDSWRLMNDEAAGLDGADHLKAVAPAGVARVSPATAAQAGLVPGGSVIVQGPTGSLALPVVVEETMVDGVVWIPTNSSSASRRSIGAAVGSPVGLTAVSNNSDIAGGVA
ncbi:NADH-quinone oxidoreductase subunit G [Luteococcus japonicus]|uniref:NADH-quinone oxidoreductase n=1 Tax=Luteococcus japonicus LSP_Lj1 TaxID=1255658 RepID=A0A1R4J2L5_9ACTN|nr:NADH-quinone oxidoreductase subunit G [Luteococcus japonicus]SJN26371.1 NADH-ubiquinone oxidoreductase chain G [Luteococcus japonicus LSP_Lj1]